MTVLSRLDREKEKGRGKMSLSRDVTKRGIRRGKKGGETLCFEGRGRLHSTAKSMRTHGNSTTQRTHA